MYLLFGLIAMLYINALHADEIARCFLPIPHADVANKVNIRYALGLKPKDGTGIFVSWKYIAEGKKFLTSMNRGMSQKDGLMATPIMDGALGGKNKIFVISGIYQRKDDLRLDYIIEREDSVYPPVWRFKYKLVDPKTEVRYEDDNIDMQCGVIYDKEDKIAYSTGIKEDIKESLRRYLMDPNSTFE